MKDLGTSGLIWLGFLISIGGIFTHPLIAIVGIIILLLGLVGWLN